MATVAIDYAEVTERTRETVMAYAQQQWPVLRSSVSLQRLLHSPT